MRTNKKSFISTFFTFVIIILFGCIILFNKQIVRYLMVNIIYQKELVIKEANDYEKKSDYQYVQRTNEFIPKNKQELFNVIYTVLNKGWDQFTFYCPTEYEDCMKDVTILTKNNEVLSYINNFIHPFNGFDKIYISTNNFGKVEIDVEKTYSEEQIQKINQKVDEILAEIKKDGMNEIETVKAIHDYIIEHTNYDNEHAEIIEKKLDKKPTYQSNTAYGTLMEGLAICGGYTDTMAIFLNRLGIDNYKISSSNHVWNYVKLDEKWYHLDLTWDDPVIDSGENVLLHNFFLLSTEELEKKDTNQHNFNKNVYLETKEKETQ